MSENKLNNVCFALNSLHMPYHIERLNGGSLVQCRIHANSPLTVFVGNTSKTRLVCRIMRDISRESWAFALCVIAEAEKLGISPCFRFQITADRDLYCIQELSCCEADSVRLQINSFLTTVNRCESLAAEHINFAKGYL